MNTQQVEDRAVEEIAEMENQIGSLLDMRAAGYTYRQIAAYLSVDVATAHRRVQRELKRQREEEPETRDDVRDLDLAKIAWLERRIMAEALNGDLEAARFVLACIRCRRQYQNDGASAKPSEAGDPYLAECEKWLDRFEQRMDMETKADGS